jgi:putative transposase
MSLISKVKPDDILARDNQQRRHAVQLTAFANSVCERFGGTLRRERLHYLIPINERHLKVSIKE